MREGKRKITVNPCKKKTTMMIRPAMTFFILNAVLVLCLPSDFKSFADETQNSAPGVSAKQDGLQPLSVEPLAPPFDPRTAKQVDGSYGSPFYDNGSNNGWYEVREKDGTLSCRAYYLNNRRWGQVSYYYPSGQVKITVDYKDGYHHGWMREFSEEGALLSETFCMQGVVLFERIYGYNKEVLYESRHYYPWPLLNNVGEFAHMKKDSCGLFKHHSGQYLQWIAQFVNGKINGFKKDFAVDRLIAECHYRDGVPDGIARFYFPHNGRLWREEEIAMGEVKHVKEYDLSGNLTIDETCFSPVQTACLTIEREKGLWSPPASAQPPFGGIDITLENRQVAYRDYKKGKLNGYSMVFSGLYDKINTIEYYVDGLKERVSLDFNKNGEWLCAHTFTSVKGGHGYHTSQDYHNGWQETSWLKGKENGVTRIYDAQGRLVEESEYKEGRLDGIAKKYFPSGQACSEEVYAHRELVSGKYFDEKGALKGGIRDAAKDRPKTCCRDAVPDDNGFFNNSQSFAYLGTITDIKEAKNFKTGSTHYVTLAISSTVLVPFRGTRQKGETIVFYYDYDWSEEQRMEGFVKSFKKGDTYFLGLHTGIDGKLNFPGKSLESFMSFTVPADMVDELGKAKLDPDADRRLYEVIMRIVERHPPEGSWVFPELFSKKFLEYLDASAKRVSFLELLVKTIVGRNVSGTSVQEAFKMLCLFSKDEQIALIEKIGQQTQDPVIRGLLDGCTMELGLPKKLASTDDAGEIEKYILMLGASAYGNRQEARQFFIAMGHSATPYLSKAMFYKNDELRWQAAEVLKEIGDLQSVQVFLQDLEDPVIRYPAIQALGRLGDPRAVDALLRMLTNQDFYTRVYSAESLANFNDSRIPKALSSALVYALERDHAIINVVSAAAEALGRSKCEQATDELLSLLDDPRAKKARNKLIKALGGRKSDKAFQALIPLLKDPDNYAKAMAAGALKDLNDPRALGPLCEALKTVSISDYNNNGDLAYAMILEAINAISGKKLSRGQGECPAGMISGF